MKYSNEKYWRRKRPPLNGYSGSKPTNMGVRTNENMNNDKKRIFNDECNEWPVWTWLLKWYWNLMVKKALVKIWRLVDITWRTIVSIIEEEDSEEERKRRSEGYEEEKANRRKWWPKDVHAVERLFVAWRKDLLLLMKNTERRMTVGQTDHK